MHIIKDLSDYSALQNDAENLINYSDSWHLKFNITKCIHLHYHFSSSTHTPTYYIKGKEISRQSETKDLGIIFNMELRWDQHNSLTSQAYRTLYLLRRTFSTPAVGAKKLLYTSLIRSQLTYCSQLWRPYVLYQRCSLH